MRQRATFSSRFGFYMVAIGSGLSLGNLWRFPYLTGNNGGGAFVLLYVFFVAAVGLPLLISELMLGKMTRSNLVGAFKIAGRHSPRWRWLGRAGILASVVVLSYYAVISGWVLHFIIQGLCGAFSEGPVRAGNIIDNLLDKGVLQIGLTSVHLIITSLIVARGIQNGIEKWAKFFMPIFIAILGGLVIHSLFMPGSVKALRFLFYPDFSKLSGTAVIDALGHAFFTLSLGFGAMVAYGSYMKNDFSLGTEGLYVAAIDTVLSLAAGLLIFPIVFSFDVRATTGPSLLFKTMPVLFGTFKFGVWVGIGFFVCLYFAALSSSISLYEGVVAFLMDEWKMPRRRASTFLGVVSFLLAWISALSSTVFKEVRVGEKGLLEIFDQIIINWTIPLVGLGLALFVGWRISDQTKSKEFVDPTSLSSVRLYPTWHFAVKWIAPIVLVSMFLIQLLAIVF